MRCKKNIIKAFLVVMVSLSALSAKASSDYLLYHEAINKAEYKIFVEKELDSGLKIYKRIFNEYEFVFAHDCIIALQVAVLAKKEQLFLEFMNKAFKNGVKLDQLYRIKYINNSSLFKTNTDKIEIAYSKLRPIYLKRIDSDLLNSLYKLYANDQLVKNGLIAKNETVHKQNIAYKPKIIATINALKALSKSKGIPSDRLTGISQKDIMKELGSQYNDLIEYYNDNKETNPYQITKSQFEINEFCFSSYLFLPIMHHLENSFSEFTTDFYIQEIKKGNLHPKDIAAVNDFPYATIPPAPIAKNGQYFGVGVRFVQPNSLCVPDSIINQNRKRFFIQNIELDRKKWEFMHKSGMYYSFGYLGCRS